MRESMFHRRFMPLHAVCLVALVVAIPGCGTDTVCVGTWNVEWLGRPDRRSGPSKGHAQVAEDLAHCIEHSGVDVLALQEIKADIRDDGAWRNTTLDAAFADLNARRGADWTHALFPDRRDGTQITGLAWNRRVVTVEDAPLPVAVSREPGPIDRLLWDRPPYAVKLSCGSGRTDFVIIGLHQKSNYGGDYSAHRAVESRDLVDQLAAVRAHFDDDDIIIIGDTNCPRHLDAGVQAYVNAGFEDGNARDEATHWRGGALDRVFTPVGQDEFEGPARVLGEQAIAEWGWTAEEFRVRGSDHLIVTSELRVLPDDDGPP